MSKRKTLRTRIVFGGVLIAAVSGLLVLDARTEMALADVRGVVLAGVLAVLGVLALREIARLARSAGTGVLLVSGLLGTFAVGLLPVWSQFCRPLLLDDVWFGLGAIVMGTFLEQMIHRQVAGAMGRIAVTLLAVLYLGAGTAILLVIRMEWGVPALVLFLAAVKCTDIGAYFTGTAVGRHKLIPWLSPGKSWEGLAGGLAAGAGAAVLAVWAFGHWPNLATGLSLAQAAGFGAVVGLFGQFADLCESLLKRSAQVKDSGALVPEFGGVLDILDSVLLAAPVSYVFLLAVR